MAKARNKVIEGDYKGKFLKVKKGCAAIVYRRYFLFKKKVLFNTKFVETYDVVTEEMQKSAASGIAKGLVGGALLGPVGMLAGGTSGKTKGTYRVIINFKDGKQSLVEVDDFYYGLITEKLALVKYKAAEQEGGGTASTADEIAKYKKLLDEGIITQKEFDTKKQQLLNM